MSVMDSSLERCSTGCARRPLKEDPSLGGLGLSAGLGMSSGPKGYTGASELSQGGLGLYAQTVAPVTRLQKSGRRWIDGWMNITRLDSASFRIARDTGKSLSTAKYRRKSKTKQLNRNILGSRALSGT